MKTTLKESNDHHDLPIHPIDFGDAKKHLILKTAQKERTSKCDTNQKSFVTAGVFLMTRRNLKLFPATSCFA